MSIRESIQENIYYVFTFLFVFGLISGFFVYSRWLQKGAEIELEGIQKFITVDLSGAVVSPGVYTLETSARVGDLIALGKGINSNASKDWVSKNLNLSKELNDSDKVYIPFEWEVSGEDTISVEIDGVENNLSSANTDLESSTTSGLINVNTATEEELTELSGIGPAYAAKIIDNRPYNSFDEFAENSGVPGNTAEKLEAQITF